MSQRLQDIRNEESDGTNYEARRFQDPWMEWAEVLNGEIVDKDEYHAIVTKNYDWKQQNLLFTAEQIEQMKNGWLEKQKQNNNNSIDYYP